MTRRIDSVPVDEAQKEQRLVKARQEGRQTGRGWVKYLRAYHTHAYAEHLDDLAGRAELQTWYHEREAAKARAEAETLRAQTPDASLDDKTDRTEQTS